MADLLVGILKVCCLHPVACTRSCSGFPSKATLVWIFYSVIATCFGLMTNFRRKYIQINLPSFPLEDGHKTETCSGYWIKYSNQCCLYSLCLMKPSEKSHCGYEEDQVDLGIKFHLCVLRGKYSKHRRRWITSAKINWIAPRRCHLLLRNFTNVFILQRASLSTQTIALQNDGGNFNGEDFKWVTLFAKICFGR
jgi:hypothetical protein